MTKSFISLDSRCVDLKNTEERATLKASWGPFCPNKFGGPGEVSPVSPPLGGPGQMAQSKKETLGPTFTALLPWDR